MSNRIEIRKIRSCLQNIALDESYQLFRKARKLENSDGDKDMIEEIKNEAKILHDKYFRGNPEKLLNQSVIDSFKYAFK